MNRDLLEKPFDPEQIKQREGYFGDVLDYLEGPTVIQRLNEAFNGVWSFDIVANNPSPWAMTAKPRPRTV